VSIAETVLTPRPRDIGAFEVRRVLPSARRRMVGPFIFFDQMGPKVFKPGDAVDVRPHPHIGLATVTYLFDGEIMHRDSLGSAQVIRPGAVNWMTAGRGIVHSERTPEDRRAGGEKLYGIQTWIALPKAHEEAPPAFVHHAADTLPKVADGGAQVVVIAGEAWGYRSPVAVFSETLYADVRLDAGARLQLPRDVDERAIYVLDGAVQVAGESFPSSTLAAFRKGDDVVIEAEAPCHLVVIGGATMDGPRHIWWNLVSSSQDRIEQAKLDWKNGRFPKVPGDETEFIPLPES
jgi:redox-sensitive bicupin YhaK (pirin superfamily)